MELSFLFSFFVFAFLEVQIYSLILSFGFFLVRLLDLFIF